MNYGASKLNAQMQSRLCSLIRAGAFYEAACKEVGLHPWTFREWMKAGDEHPDEPGYEHFVAFRAAIQQAEAECENRIVENFRNAAETNWQAALSFLERRFKSRWSKTDQTVAVQAQGKVAIYIPSNGRDSEEEVPTEVSPETVTDE